MRSSECCQIYIHIQSCEDSFSDYHNYCVMIDGNYIFIKSSCDKYVCNDKIEKLYKDNEIPLDVECSELSESMLKYLSKAICFEGNSKYLTVWKRADTLLVKKRVYFEPKELADSVSDSIEFLEKR